MNPSYLPVWLKVTVGSLIVTAIAVFPYLSKSTDVSPHAHAVLNVLGALWLFGVNTYHLAQKAEAKAEVEKVSLSSSSMTSTSREADTVPPPRVSDSSEPMVSTKDVPPQEKGGASS